MFVFSLVRFPFDEYICLSVSQSFIVCCPVFLCVIRASSSSFFSFLSFSFSFFLYSFIYFVCNSSSVLGILASILHHFVNLFNFDIKLYEGVKDS